MDFFEGLFEKAAGLWVQRRNRTLLEKGASFEEHFPTLSLLARAACSGRSLELRAIDESSFLQGDVLALPTRVSRFSSFEHNRFALLHLALAGGARRALQGVNNRDSTEADCHALLSSEFPGFPAWHAAGAAALREELSASGIKQELNEWLWPTERQAGTLSLRTPAARGSRKRNPGRPKTEKEGKRPPNVAVTCLEEKKPDQNPVMHSFEKLETADAYHGGHRITDATDQLEEHADALDELSLTQVTRSGDSAESIYQADTSDALASDETPLSEPEKKPFLWYPEWDYRQQHLVPKHCRLYLESGSNVGDGESWSAHLEEAYSSALLQWQKRWWGIVNEQVWRNRHWDGERLDVDAYVRYRVDVSSGAQGDGRVFARKTRGDRDLATLILLDQSLSTDSFIDGRRVLDVEVESIGLAGLLLSPLRFPVCVAGTWSETRSHCHFRTYKQFDSPWEEFFGQAPQIEPQGYTRLGPAIRHATQRLADTGARCRLLILLTDGKPTDYDRYEGRYGTEDIYHAFLEAKQRGVEVRAIAIERDAKHYFPKLFGPRNYKVVPSAHLLPESLFHLFLEASRR